MDTNKGYPLLVVQCQIIGHPTRTEHWSLIVALSAEDAEFHELRGNYDTFAYVSETEKNWVESRALCGGCLVGYIPKDELPNLPDMLKKVEVVRHNPSFDCQTWIVLVLRMLKENGFVFEDMTEKALRDELADEMERNETGHDVVYERIFRVGED